MTMVVGEVNEGQRTSNGERGNRGGGYQMCKGIECWCAKKKGMFIEMNIPRNENFTIQAKTLVAFVVKIIAKKSARHGLVLQFMFVVRGRLGQLGAGRCCMKEDFNWGFALHNQDGQPIGQKNIDTKYFIPVFEGRNA